MGERKAAAVTLCQIDEALEERQNNDRRKQKSDVVVATERRQKDRRVSGNNQS